MLENIELSFLRPSTFSAVSCEPSLLVISEPPTRRRDIVCGPEVFAAAEVDAVEMSV